MESDLASERLTDPRQLTLQDITNLTLLDGFTTWWIARRSRVTVTIHQRLARLRVIAQYWLKDADRALEIARIGQSLLPAERVQDKRTRWLSLQDLERIGQSRYPLNARQPLEISYAARVKDHKRVQGNLKRYALWATLVLILRLLVCIPLMSRYAISLRERGGARRERSSI